MFQVVNKTNKVRRNKAALALLLTSAVVTPSFVADISVEAASQEGVYSKDGKRVVASGLNEAYVIQPDGLLYDLGKKKVVAGLTDVKEIYNSSLVKLAVKTDGTVWTWGSNTYGQLGDGTTIKRDVPQQVEGISNVRDVSVHGEYVLVIKNDGTVWGWGRGDKLGLGITDNKTRPVQINGLDNAVSVDTGNHGSVVTKADGTVWAWGPQSAGSMGHFGSVGLNKTLTVPTRIVEVTDAVRAVTNNGTLIQKKDGTLWAIGQGTFRGDSGSSSDKGLVQVKIPDKVVDIDMDFSSVIALTDKGDVWTWGGSDSGSIMLGSGIKGYTRTPEKLTEFSGAKAITMGQAEAFVVNGDGSLWGWGRNNMDQLQKGSYTEQLKAIKVGSVVAKTEVDAGDAGNGTGDGETGGIGTGGASANQKAMLLLNGGALSLTAPEIQSFGRINLTPQPQKVTSGFTDAFSVSDARGTGEGWRLAVSATQFEMVEPVGGFAAGTNGHTLPAGTLTLKPLEMIARQGRAPGADPTSKMTFDNIIDSGAVTVASANVNEGMGDFKLSFGKDALGLIIDSATAKIDKVNYPTSPTPYEATVTWTLVTGP